MDWSVVVSVLGVHDEPRSIRRAIGTLATITVHAMSNLVPPFFGEHVLCEVIRNLLDIRVVRLVADEPRRILYYRRTGRIRQGAIHGIARGQVRPDRRGWAEQLAHLAQVATTWRGCIVVRGAREDVHTRLAVAQEPVLLEHLARVLVVVAHHCTCVCLASAVVAFEQCVFGAAGTGGPESAVDAVAIEVRSATGTEQTLTIER